MKKIITLLIAVLLLCGCAEEVPETPTEPQPGESLVWETMPQLTYGIMEYEKLEVLPWYSGRCEATSFEFMAETRDGYYLNLGYKQLLYADKGNMEHWVPVCSKPNCRHVLDNWSDGQIVCDSELRNTFAIRDGRIWYTWYPYGEGFEELGGKQALMSMKPDGSDKRIECLMDTGAPTIKTSGAYASAVETLYNEIAIEEDGLYTVCCYRVADGELEEYYTLENLEEVKIDMAALQNAFNVPIYGDPLLYNGALAQTKTSYLRGYGEAQEMLELGELPIKYAYLSGDVLRFFRSGDGYYDINIRTGEEVKLADCQLENSHAAVVLPNCILESTLLTPQSMETRTPGQTHRLMLFDGESWREVALPKELQMTNSGFLRFKCVTSDCIILKLQYAGSIEQSDLYRIDLTKDELTLEFFAHFNGYVPCT